MLLSLNVPSVTKTAGEVYHTLENVEISARAGFENENFIEAENYSSITLKNVRVSGYTEPTVLLKSEGKLDFENSTLIKIDR